MRAFTLIEILIVVVLLGILAGMVIPRYIESDKLARENIMSQAVHSVRQLLQYHRHSGEVSLAASGWPEQIQSSWFSGGHVPVHTWTGSPMIVNTVDGAADALYPATKTFSLSTAGAANAWYNRTNGAFCVLVPSAGSASQTLASFNAANQVNAASLAATN